MVKLLVILFIIKLFVQVNIFKLFYFQYLHLPYGIYPSDMWYLYGAVWHLILYVAPLPPILPTSLFKIFVNNPRPPNSNPTALFVALFPCLNGSSSHICFILLNGIIDRDASSLGTLVPGGP